MAALRVVRFKSLQFVVKAIEVCLLFTLRTLMRLPPS